MGTPFLTVMLVVFGGFLSLLALLSLAVTKTVNPDGQSTRGCFGGCAAALALVFLAGVGAVGLGTFVVASAVGTAVDHNPIERIEIRRGSPHGDALDVETYETVDALDALDALEHFENDDKHGPVHLLFTMRGNAGQELIELVKEVVHIDHQEIEEFVTIHTRTGSDGEEFQIVEFQLPFGDKDLNELEREIERELDGLEIDLPDSIVVEFEGAKRFY
jgi:hypothetical protein